MLIKNNSYTDHLSNKQFLDHVQIPYSCSQRHELYVGQGFCSHWKRIFAHFLFRIAAETLRSS